MLYVRDGGDNSKSLRRLDDLMTYGRPARSRFIPHCGPIWKSLDLGGFVRMPSISSISVIQLLGREACR